MDIIYSLGVVTNIVLSLTGFITILGKLLKK